MRKSGFAIASLICGICSVCMCCAGPLAVIPGALSILFAILPYRKGEKKDSFSTTGIVLSCVGIALGILMTVYTLFDFSISMQNPAYRREFNSTFERIYGESFDDYMENLYGITIE